MDADTSAPSPSHALSGRNPTLFNAVLQYADMDMLRTLALTSCTIYETLQGCQFDHLSLVVLEAPILAKQQQVVYNGADPMPSDTFRLPLDKIVRTALVETTSSVPSAQTLPSQTQNSTLVEADALDTWRQQSTVFNNYDHNLIIPDYARDLMARSKSVELVVYRRRLGTHISSFFTTNERHLKHGRPLACDDCTSSSSSKSNVTTSATAQYKLHLACLPPTPTPAPHAQHCSADDVHTCEKGDDNAASSTHNDCIFSKHCSHQYFEKNGIQLRRLRRHMFPDRSGHCPSDCSSLQLKFLQHTTTNGDLKNEVAPYNMDRNDTNCTKHKHRASNIVHRDDHLFVAAGCNNTNILRPRFQNLPLVAQHALTTSLIIRIVDCMSFGVEDWCNAMPGCTIQPIQTWIIHDDPSPAHCRYRPTDFTTDINDGHFLERAPPATFRPNVDYDEDEDENIGRHFPHLTSLVLQYTRLDEANRCGIGSDDPDLRYDVCADPPLRLSHFFIDGYIHLPHLQHFGVVGTLLDYEQYAMISFHNARTTSLSINPGPRCISYNATLSWISGLGRVWDGLEIFHALPSSAPGHTVTIPAIPNEEDIDRYFTHREPPPQPCYESAQGVETAKNRHKLRPRCKYNFSIDFASSYLESCCPHKTHIFAPSASVNTQADVDNDTPVHIPPEDDELSQFNQHRATCAAIRNALSTFCTADGSGRKTNYTLSLSESLTLSLPFSPAVDRGDFLSVTAIARLVHRTLSYLEMRCHYCSHANPGSTPFPGAPPGDCTATHLPPPANALSGISDLPQDADALTRVCDTQPNKEMYMRLRQLLQIPPHVVLRL